MRIEATVSVEPGALFVQDAFRTSVGKSFALHWGEVEGQATLIAAHVEDGGQRAVLTLEFSQEGLPKGLDLPSQVWLKTWLDERLSHPTDPLSRNRDRLLYGDWPDEVCS